MLRSRRLIALAVIATGFWCCKANDSRGVAGGGGFPGISGSGGKSGDASGGANGGSAGISSDGWPSSGSGGTSGGSSGSAGGSSGASGGATGGSSGSSGSGGSGGSSGGPSVIFDRTSSAKVSGANSLFWTHTVSGSNDALLVEASVGVSNDVGCHLVVTDNGATMTKLAVVHPDQKRVGYFDVFGLAGVPAGANLISAHVSSCPVSVSELTGGALSFDGVDQSTPFSAATNTYGSSSKASGTLSTSTSGDLIAGFVAAANGISSAALPSMSRYIANEKNDTGAGNSAGATAPATGSNVTLSWTLQSAGYWGVSLVEVNHL